MNREQYMGDKPGKQKKRNGEYANEEKRELTKVERSIRRREETE